ncbi:hypothetical protein OHB12_28940 [Nocardia sp. NBC_01730]|uniref:hypothetical protein n=1 Tax=Nocardia sp. NBC_01730 TaxID=2975998 RepID=UPI002E0E9269|nr:hypothetical protein OHB12_28940 [Nocardia sp. NBC_01730]
MIKRSTRAAIAAFALTAATLVGTIGTAATATAAPSIAHTAAPSVGELQSKLQLVLNTGASRAGRAAELEAGDPGVSIADQVAARIAMFPSYRWSVVGPVDAHGDSLTAQLKTAVDGFEDLPLIEVSWRQIDGTWKLTREALCTVAYYASVPCAV